MGPQEDESTVGRSKPSAKNVVERVEVVAPTSIERAFLKVTKKALQRREGIAVDDDGGLHAMLNVRQEGLTPLGVGRPRLQSRSVLWRKLHRGRARRRCPRCRP